MLEFKTVNPHASDGFPYRHITDTKTLLELIPLRFYNDGDAEGCVGISKYEGKIKVSLPNSTLVLKEKAESLIDEFEKLEDGIYCYDTLGEKVVYDFVQQKPIVNFAIFPRSQDKVEGLLCLDHTEKRLLRVYGRQGKPGLMYAIHLLQYSLIHPKIIDRTGLKTAIFMQLDRHGLKIPSLWEDDIKQVMEKINCHKKEGELDEKLVNNFQKQFANLVRENDAKTHAKINRGVIIVGQKTHNLSEIKYSSVPYSMDWETVIIDCFEEELEEFDSAKLYCGQLYFKRTAKSNDAETWMEKQGRKAEIARLLGLQLYRVNIQQIVISS